MFEEIPYDHLQLLWACRLIPLIKGIDGIRPIGIGEVIRRIMGKCVLSILKEDIKTAAGLLQTCCGLESGIEACIHGMAQIFESEECEAILLVDAKNAFNLLSRKVALNNIAYSCPEIHTFLNNSYKCPASLHTGDGNPLQSQEGVTQGDPLSMAMYALSTQKFISELRERNPDVKQAWFADDGTGGHSVKKTHNWWTDVKQIGPKYGIFPEGSKCLIILKNETYENEAKSLFGEDGVKITTMGERHLGAALGRKEFREKYVAEKIKNWANDVSELSEIAKDEPQLAFSAFNVGISQRWKFVQRTIKNISHLFEPLERVIRDEFIPAICGRDISDTERRLFALPYRLGGLGIVNPVESADAEYERSKIITSELTSMIFAQEEDYSKFSQEEAKKAKAMAMSEKEKTLKDEQSAILQSVDVDAKLHRLISAASEKGASAWLSALPLQRLGYLLNKQEFRDSIALRYGWPIKDMPKFCACGKDNSIDHALSCKKGGYVVMRHNTLRNIEAKLMENVAKDVQIEPKLLPVEGAEVAGNVGDQSRLDISARGIWGQQEKTFFDVRIAHPNADSHIHKPLASLYKENEKEKKEKYNARVLNIEKASFCPLVFLTTGGMSPECEALNKRIATLIANKTSENYSQVMTYLRTRLRFALLKATVIAVRGYRGRAKKEETESCVDEISFNIIPEK